jgi:hypothetical protein
MTKRSSFLIVASVVPTLLWSGMSYGEEPVDFDALNGLLAYPEEYLSTAPSETIEPGANVDQYHSDGRGDVTRWEYRQGRSSITREVWNDNETGEPKARLGIGRNF